MEEELENLIVRLTGDSSDYRRMLDDALERTKEFGRTVTATLATVAEAVGFKQSAAAFSSFQDDLVRVEAALKSNGLAVESTMEDYRKFTDQIEATTRVSSIQATKLLALAGFYDMVGEKAKGAVQQAIGISMAREGVSPTEALRAIAIYQRTGAPSYLGRLLGLYGRGAGAMGGGGAAGKEQMTAEIEKQLKTAQEVAEKLSGNFGGQLAKLTNLLQHLKVEIGEIVAKWAKPVIDFLTQFTNWVLKLDPGLKEMGVALLALVTAMTAAGPLMRFFLLLGSLVTSISPLTVIFTGLAIATTMWVRQVGGLAAAWERVWGTIQSVGANVLSYLQNFIATHQRLTLAVGLVTAAVVASYAAWRILTVTWATINAVLTALYIKQAAQIALHYGLRLAVLSYNAALVTTKYTATALSLLLSSAQWLGSLVLQAARIATLTGLWLGWKAIIASALILFYGTEAACEAVSSAFKGIVMAGLILTVAIGGLTKAVADFFTLLGSFAWAVYTGAISLATLATMAFDAAETVATFGLNLLVGAVLLAVAAFGAWELVLYPVIALVGVLFTTVVSLGTFLIGTGAAVLSFGAAMGGVFAAGFLAAQGAVDALLDTLLAIPGTTGPLAQIGGMFMEWFGILMSVYHAATLLPETLKKIQGGMKGITNASSGLDLAWELLLAGFKLAVAEIRAAWPPLWAFIQTVALGAWKVLQAGWTAFAAQVKVPFLRAWSELVTSVKRMFFQMLYEIVTGLLEASRGSSLANMFGGTDALAKAQGQVTDLLNSARTEYFRTKAHGYQGMADDARVAEDAVAKLNAELEEQKKVIAEAARNFGVAETDEVKAARARVEELQGLIAKATAQQTEDQKKLGQFDPAKGFEQGTKEIHKWEAALLGSAEAASRVQEYYDKLSESLEESRKAKGGEATGAGGGPAPVNPIFTGEPVPVEANPSAGNNPPGQDGIKALLSQIIAAVLGDTGRPRPVIVQNVKGAGL